MQFTSAAIDTQSLRRQLVIAEREHAMKKQLAKWVVSLVIVPAVAYALQKRLFQQIDRRM